MSFSVEQLNATQQTTVNASRVASWLIGVIGAESASTYSRFVEDKIVERDRSVTSKLVSVAAGPYGETGFAARVVSRVHYSFTPGKPDRRSGFRRVENYGVRLYDTRKLLNAYYGPIAHSLLPVVHRDGFDPYVSLAFEGAELPKPELSLVSAAQNFVAGWVGCLARQYGLRTTSVLLPPQLQIDRDQADPAYSPQTVFDAA